MSPDFGVNVWQRLVADLPEHELNKKMINTNSSVFDRTVTLREAFQLLGTFIGQYHARGERQLLIFSLILVLVHRDIQVTLLSSNIF